MPFRAIARAALVLDLAKIGQTNLQLQLLARTVAQQIEQAQDSLIGVAYILHSDWPCLAINRKPQQNSAGGRFSTLPVGLL